jgi:3-hydroxymyristoyl/3-hydroxydecanoyl-(acyl carrier protein) dehydratase
MIVNENLHSVENEKILSRDDTSILLEFCIPAESDFFDGHFPEYKLLPAVAQFELVTRFSKKYFGTQRYVPRIHRIKFSAPIRPDSTLQLKMNLNREKSTVTYSLYDAKNTEKVYSSGTFTAAMQETQSA